jgi:hypothetical protein
MNRAMNRSQPAPVPGPRSPVPPEPSQYLKVAYSSKRYYRLMALAREMGCSWQSIALLAIDELLDRESPHQNRP